MALGRSTKISILLAIDLCFFFVELIVGYAVGSLALVADSFHMLNDVMSLIVALYAIKLTKNNVASAEYSYGWHRAEILAALINGVFLLALCFSIFIEAIERFFSVPEVGSPKLVVIVGSLGLASNIIGLFLFHEHGHDHGHSPSSPEPLTPPPGTKAFPDGNLSTSSLTPLLPPGSIAPPPHSLSAHPPSIGSSSNGKVVITNSPSHRRSESIPRRRRSNSNTSISFHPAQVRASLVQVAEEMRAEEQEEQAYMAAASSPKKHSPMKRTFSRHETRSSLDHIAVAEAGDSYSRAEEGRIATTTTAPGRRNDAVDSDSDDEDAPLDSTLRRPHGHNHSHVHAHDPNHDGHASSGNGGGGHGHAHGSMNMHAVLLHVIGDALGNVGVIATGLIIWLTEWKWKYYCDPSISLIITCIIFSSALPLVKSASFILLQGVPTSVSLVDVRNAILSIPGVISVHELHIWQLSESKIVASVHVLVRKSLKGCKKTNGGGNSVPSTPPNGKVNSPSNSQSEAVSLVVGTDDRQDDETTDVEGGEHVYMAVASEIRRILHEFGIHSSTIQPEYATDGMDDETASQHSGCLIPCTLDAECDPANACCPPAPVRQGTN